MDYRIMTVQEPDWDDEPQPAMSVYPALFVFEARDYRPLVFPEWVKESPCGTHSHLAVVPTPHGVVWREQSFRNPCVAHVSAGGEVRASGVHAA